MRKCYGSGVGVEQLNTMCQLLSLSEPGLEREAATPAKHSHGLQTLAPSKFQ